MDNNNRLTINGYEYTFEDGETILDVASRNNIFIPTLCHLKGTINTGACRVCLVEVKGARGLVPACTMPVNEGMEIRTDSKQVIETRAFVVAMLMVSGNHNCAARGVSDGDWTDFQLGVRGYDKASDICDAYSGCKLQEYAYLYQTAQVVSDLRLPGLKTDYELEDASPFIVRDFSRCILCGRCVKSCNEIQYNNAISYGYRGAAAKIVTRGDNPLVDSDCVFCGECIQSCPVGALVEKDTRYRARPWEVEQVKSTCGYCATGCCVDLFVKEGRVVKAGGTESGAVNDGHLCIRGRYGNDYLTHPDRLKQPLLKRDEELVPAGMDEALDFVAGKLKGIKQAYGPESIAAFATTRISNEDAFVLQKFFRDVVGTANIDNAARLVDTATLVGLQEVLGVSAGTNPADDIDVCDVLLLAGCDITNSHPVLGGRVKRGAGKRGLALIVVDPAETDIVAHARMHLQPKPGTDVAWANGFIHVLLEQNLVDSTPASGYEGFDEMREAVKAYTPEHVEKVTGIPAADLVAAAKLYASATRAAVYYGSGLTQQINGTDNVKSLANLALLGGNIGDEGGGINPLRGQCNAQGVCDMGCLPEFGPGYRKLSKPGLTILETMAAIEEGKVKALYVVGEDLLASLPDTAAVQSALKKLDLLVVNDLFLTDTGRLADAVLPAAAFAQKEGTFTNTERRVQRIRKAATVQEVQEDWRIFAALASRLGVPMSYEGAAEAFAEAAGAIPDYAGISHGRLDALGSLQWPCPAPNHPGTPRLVPEAAGFRFASIEYAAPPNPPDIRYPHVMITGEVLKQYYHHSSVKDHLGVTIAEIGYEDAQKKGLEEYDTIRLVSRTGSAEVPVRVTHRFPAGVVFVPWHFGDTSLGQLIASSVDAHAGTPGYRFTAVRLEKSFRRKV